MSIADVDRGGLRVWCETTKPGEKYAECETGYCPTCKQMRNQMNSGFLMCAYVAVLHDDQGEPFDYPIGHKQGFSQGICCAACGATLTASPEARLPSRARAGGSER